MLYQLNYIHHLWDCKDSVFLLNNPNIFVGHVLTLKRGPQSFF